MGTYGLLGDRGMQTINKVSLEPPGGGSHISKSKSFEHAPNIVNGPNKMICLHVCISPPHMSFKFVYVD